MDFKCSICNRDYDQFQRIPRVLQCGHSYCQKCIRSNKNDKKNIFTCPFDQKTSFFRKQVDQVPINQEIIKALKEIKHQNLSKSRVNFVLKSIQIENKKLDSLCIEHKKLKQYLCKTDGILICSHCAILGDHRGHSLQSINKVKQVQVLESLKIIQNQIKKLECCTKVILQSPNSVTKCIQKCKKQLKNEIKQIFKLYHDILTRKQSVLQKEIEQLAKGYKKQLGNYEQRIEQNWKKYNEIKYQLNLIKTQLDNQKQANSLYEFELKEIFNKISQIKPCILKLDDQIKQKTQTFIKTYKNKFRQTDFIKIQQSFISFINQKKQEKLRQTRINSKNTKQQKLYSSKLSNDHIINSRISSFSDQYNIITNNLAQSKIITISKENKNLKNYDAKKSIRKQNTVDLNQHNNISNTVNNNLQNKKNKNQQKKRDKTTQQTKSLFLQNINKQKNNTNQESHVNDQIKQHKPHVNDQNKQHSPQVKKQKKVQLKYQARSKIEGILKVIQKVDGFNLELIGLQIQDSYINSIFEFIRKHEKTFGTIKLVMNDITDDGFQIILDNLINDEITHTLHLTSNKLSECAIDKIIEFGLKNRVLKKFSLMKNKISKINIKQKLLKLNKMGIQISL